MPLQNVFSATSVQHKCQTGVEEKDRIPANSSLSPRAGKSPAARNSITFFTKPVLQASPKNWGIDVRKSLQEFKYMTFDVVGTLIDFEGGLKDCLAGIAAEAGVAIDGEEALSLYRAARYSKDADLFPDDLVRVYLEIAPKLGLPAEPKYGERFRDSTKNWKGFADSAEALARLAKSCRLVAMTNARRWAFDLFAQQLGNPFTRHLRPTIPGLKNRTPSSSRRSSISSARKEIQRTTFCMSPRANITISAFPESSGWPTVGSSVATHRRAMAAQLSPPNSPHPITISPPWPLLPMPWSSHTADQFTVSGPNPRKTGSPPQTKRGMT